MQMHRGQTHARLLPPAQAIKHASTRGEKKGRGEGVTSAVCVAAEVERTEQSEAFESRVVSELIHHFKEFSICSQEKSVGGGIPESSTQGKECRIGGFFSYNYGFYCEHRLINDVTHRLAQVQTRG